MPETETAVPDPKENHKQYLLGKYQAFLEEVQSGKKDPKTAAIELTTQHLELEKQATLDGLTGFLNNAGFSNELTGEMELAKRLKQPACLLAIDVDQLKRFNDEMGHVAGDQLIQLYSQVIEINTRAHDLKGRVGGDEFCVFLLGADPDQAKIVSDRMRENIIDAVEKQFPNLAWEQTMSIGIAELEKADEVPGLREKADKALYQAKIARNETRVFGETISTHK